MCDLREPYDQILSWRDICETTQVDLDDCARDSLRVLLDLIFRLLIIESLFDPVLRLIIYYFRISFSSTRNHVIIKLRYLWAKSLS